MSSKIECNKCGEMKELILFKTDARAKLGVQMICKQCACDVSKKYYENNRIKIIEKKKNKKYNISEKQKKKYRETRKIWVSNNRDKVNRSRQRYRLNNPIKTKQVAKINNERQKKSGYTRDYYKKNYKKNKLRNKISARKGTEKMNDYYMAKLMGLAVKDCPAELISLKRQQLKVNRELRK